MRKCTALLLVTCLVVSSLLVFTVPFVSAQSGFKPSVPEFTVKLIDNSYVEPPAYTIDPYTGETKLVWVGGYVSNKTIEVTIKNQPFTPYTNASNHKFDLYYIIEVKGHYSEYWGNLGSSSYDPFYSQRSSDDVVAQVPANNYKDGSQLEFRVKAVVAYDSSTYNLIGLKAPLLDVHATSDYSDIKTLTITSISLPSQTATLPTSPITSYGNGYPQYPGQTHSPNSIFSDPLFLLGVGALFTGVIIIVVMVFRQHLKTPTYTNDTLQTNPL